MFNWDEANKSHIAAHDVLPAEAEEAVTNNPQDIAYQTQAGELRIRQVGETSAGRILTVVTTVRGRLIRVVTAFPANRRQRAEYLEFKGKVQNEPKIDP